MYITMFDNTCTCNMHTKIDATHFFSKAWLYVSLLHVCEWSFFFSTCTCACKSIPPSFPSYLWLIVKFRVHYITDDDYGFTGMDCGDHTHSGHAHHLYIVTAPLVFPGTSCSLWGGRGRRENNTCNSNVHVCAQWVILHGKKIKLFFHSKQLFPYEEVHLLHVLQHA